jgi:hypothetical protein
MEAVEEVKEAVKEAVEEVKEEVEGAEEAGAVEVVRKRRRSCRQLR